MRSKTSISSHGNPLFFTAADADAIVELLDVAFDTGDQEAEATAVIDLTADAAPLDQPAVEVRVLGPVDVVGAVRPFERPKALELVVYLALDRNPQDADRIQCALWPDKRPSTGTFNTTTYRARAALGDDPAGQPYLPKPPAKGTTSTSSATQSPATSTVSVVLSQPRRRSRHKKRSRS